jgi:gliding motility-associated-like protein
MKQLFLIILVSLFSFILQGQNLIPNYSFEQMDTCPYNQAQICFAYPWFQPCTTYTNYPPCMGSSDYWNACSSSWTIPQTGWGFQLARTGNGFAGIHCYGSDEYIEVKLTDSLTANKRYCVSFYCVLPDKMNFAVDDIGAYLSFDTIWQTDCTSIINNISVTPQISNPSGNFLTDTVNWSLISGIFLSAGGEKFITIGNFKSYLNTDTLIVNNTPGFNSAYYWIDDVSVIELLYDTANAGGDKAVCGNDSVTIGTANCSGCIYQWIPGTGLSDSTVAQPKANPAAATTYVLVMTDTSTGTVCEWTSTDTITVSVLPAAQYDTADAGTAQTICEGDSIIIGTPPCSGCYYNWQSSGGLTDTAIAQPIAFPLQTTTYVLTMIDSVSPCFPKTTIDSVTVTIISSTNNANAGNDQTSCEGESVVLGTVLCSGCTYQWQPSTWLSDATIAQPAATPLQTTAYILVMTDSFPPCVKITTDAITVFVEDCTLEIYNIFTPNADTKNDFFFIKNLPSNSALQVFNRWGSVVFQSDNYNNKWDGDAVPDGTYYYILVLPSKVDYHGFVEISR